MTKRATEVSVPFRVAAWVLLLGSLGALVDLLMRVLRLGGVPVVDEVLTGLLLLFGVVTFGYVALTGRSPAVVSQLEEGFNERHGIKPSSKPASWRGILGWIVAVVVGTVLVAAADARSMFGEEIRGLVFLVYAIAAVALVVLVWRCVRYRRGRGTGASFR